MALVGVVKLILTFAAWSLDHFNFPPPFFLQLWTSENQGDEGDAGEGEN